MFKILLKDIQNVFSKTAITQSRFKEIFAPINEKFIDIWRSQRKLPKFVWAPACVAFSVKSENDNYGGKNNNRRGDRRNRKHRVSMPKLIYLQHPWKFIRNKFDLLRLQLFWDLSFHENDFLYGTTKAVVVMTKHIRELNTGEVHNVTTPLGYQQISRDMILSREDPRMQLLRFRMHDIQRAIPIKIHFIKRFGTKHCLIDMFFVGMRYVHDFNFDEALDILENVRLFDKLFPPDVEAHQVPPPLPVASSRRILFAEIYTRFHREYTKGSPEEWSVAFFKVANFDVLSLK